MKIMKQKMIFLDLDGTLLNDQKELPERNKEAIKKALAVGHKVFLCTGRPLSSARKQIPLLGLDQKGCYAITYNGGLIWDSYEEKVIYKKTISRETVACIFQKAQEHGMYAQTYTDTLVLCQKDCQESRDYSRLTKIDRTITKDIFQELGQEEPCKALCIAPGYDREKLEAFRKVLEESLKGKADLMFSCYEYLEIVPLQISKGNAIRFMSEYLKIPMEDTIAVGDAENDISMIQAAGLGAVMKNASEEIKKYGDYITKDDNNAGGVGEVIEKFMLV